MREWSDVVSSEWMIFVGFKPCVETGFADFRLYDGQGLAATDHGSALPIKFTPLLNKTTAWRFLCEDELAREEKEISTLGRVEICRYYSHKTMVEDNSNHIGGKLFTNLSTGCV